MPSTDSPDQVNWQEAFMMPIPNYVWQNDKDIHNNWCSPWSMTCSHLWSTYIENLQTSITPSQIIEYFRCYAAKSESRHLQSSQRKKNPTMNACQADNHSCCLKRLYSVWPPNLLFSKISYSWSTTRLVIHK